MVHKKKKTIRKKKLQNTTGNYSKGGVSRIDPPFTRFANHSQGAAMPHLGIQQSSGLSSKDRNFIICSCQAKPSRYPTLKTLASSAIKENKIFSVYGSCSAVRKALIQRGWVEKIPQNRMNLSKIRNGTITDRADIHCELEKLLLSNLVEKHNPNFIWRVKDDAFEPSLIDMMKNCNTIINKLHKGAMWTTKQGLCSSMARNYWFYIEGVAEVDGPRTYISYEEDEMDEFVKDYKITACTSLLKWILTMVSNERPIFLDTGKISLNVFVFALNRCKEYLFHKHHKDVDRSMKSTSSSQWDAFLNKYYRIIEKQDVFRKDTANKLPLYLGYAKYLLKEIHKYRPQLSCEGCHNIWIIKPAYCSRGRGIRMASKLAVISSLLNKANNKHIIQKYIEEPLLIHDTKFDIRQYYLVTSTYPLVIWMYRDCYLKFSCQKYNLRNYHESIHLTNNAVQRKYKNCSGRHIELPEENMWELSTYKKYLNRIGKDKVWDNIIYPGMKKSIVSIVLSCQDSLTASKNRFELYGCDFILDKEYRPWLIEINSCPDLNHTTPVTARICPSVVSDIIKVVIDNAADPSSSTGAFECIYRQPIAAPRYVVATDLFVRGYSLPLDYFYRGKININECYDDPYIGKEHDVNIVLEKLKQQHDTDIMVEPDEDVDDTDKVDKVEFIGCAHNTDSENELCLAASAIIEQLNELMDSIPLKSNDSSRVKQRKQLAVVSNMDSIIRRLISATTRKALITNSTNIRASNEEVINNRQPFKFSALDDGPTGKGSLTEFNPDQEVCKKNISIDHFKNENNESYNDNIIKAATKLITFINKKENEYFSGNF